MHCMLVTVSFLYNFKNGTVRFVLRVTPNEGRKQERAKRKNNSIRKNKDRRERDYSIVRFGRDNAYSKLLLMMINPFE